MLVLCTGLALSRSAQAQRSAGDIETARQLYNQGIELRDKGDLKGALEKLKAAHALGNTPITGLDLCKTYAALNQPVEAREVCLGVGRIPPVAAETARSQEARNEAARVAEDQRPKLASVRLHVTGVPPRQEPTVTFDGAPVPVAALAQPRAVNPGRHDITARVGKGAESRSSFDLGAGETKDVTMPVQPPPVDAEPTVPPEPAETPKPVRHASGLATAGFIIGGVGVGVGAVAGLVAISKKSTLDSNCTDKLCGVPDHDTLDSAKTWANVSTVSFIVGGAGLLVGLYGVLTAPKSSASSPGSVRTATVTLRPVVGPASLGVHGSF